MNKAIFYINAINIGHGIHLTRHFIAGLWHFYCGF